MESSVVGFIMENIILFLVLGTIGIVITIYLFLTGEKVDQETKDNLESDYISISKFKFNIYVLVYLFIVIMIIIIGVFSNFIKPISIGGIIALIPVFLLTLLKIKVNTTKGH